MSTSAIDRTVFDQLLASTGGDMAFIADLVGEYFSDSLKLIGHMRQALAANEIDNFRRAAHSLKSTSANFGAMTLSALAKELEMMAKAGSLDGAAEKITRVEEEYGRVKAELAAAAQ